MTHFWCVTQSCLGQGLRHGKPVCQATWDLFEVKVKINLNLQTFPVTTDKTQGAFATL